MRMASSSHNLVLSLIVCLFQLVHCCIHDSLDHKYVTGVQTYDENHPFLVNERQRRLGWSEVRGSSVNRELASSPYQPIRITPYYDESSLSTLSAATRAEIVKVVEEAVRRIGRALKVVPVTGNLFAERYCPTMFTGLTPPVCHEVASNELCLEMPVPDAHFAQTRYCNSCGRDGTCTGCKYTAAGTGVSNTDFLIYVRAEDTLNCASGSTLAYASTCQQDQYDRPTFGMVNFCPKLLSTASSAFERQVSTALHEFSHALGFSSRFFPLMRDEDGSPRTPRDQQGNPPTYTRGTCPNGDPISYYVQPADTTIKHFTERNHVVAKMVTPRVRAFVRDHFGCPTLEGAEIESQDGGCLGSHWEERLFEPEYMTPVDSFRNVFSALTLAFFADSGWYRVNASASEIMHFGRKKGCRFAEDKCVDPTTQTPLDANHFCTSSDFQGCTVDATSRSTCSLAASEQTIPSEYQYFPSNPKKGGVNRFADFCPLNVGYTYGDCSIPTNLIKLGSTTVNPYGETYCPTCKCTSSSLRSEDSAGWSITPTRLVGCFAMECEADDDPTIPTIVKVTIPRSKTNDAVSVRCTQKGEKLAVPGFSGLFTCPDPFVVCAVDDPSRVLLADTVISTSTSVSATSTPSPTIRTPAPTMSTPAPTTSTPAPTAPTTSTPAVTVRSSVAPTSTPTTSSNSSDSGSNSSSGSVAIPGAGIDNTTVTTRNSGAEKRSRVSLAALLGSLWLAFAIVL